MLFSARSVDEREVRPPKGIPRRLSAIFLAAAGFLCSSRMPLTASFSRNTVSHGKRQKFLSASICPSLCFFSEGKFMTGRFRKPISYLFLVSAIFLFPLHLMAQDGEQALPQATPPESSGQKASLNQAIMCEKVENLNPVRQAIVFSVSVGQVYCFTSFDPVPTPSLIYHRWFHHNELSTQTRLRLYPPKWATYSVIQLRETDKGPWRVEISDQNGHVFEVLRFSITD